MFQLQPVIATRLTRPVSAAEVFVLLLFGEMRYLLAMQAGLSRLNVFGGDSSEPFHFA